MPIHIPQGDLARTITHEPDQEWPDEVQVRLMWMVDGRPTFRTETITSGEFFGHNGAPMDGAALVGMIERMRRAGPPQVLKRQIIERKKARGKR